MPLMSHSSSPWDLYPFRQPLSTQSGSLGQTNASPVGSHPGGQAKLNGSNSLRESTHSPGSLTGTGLGSRTSISSQSGLMSSRTSLGSIGSIGTINSRPSLSSVASMSSAEVESTATGGSDSNLSMWHNNDEPQTSKSLLMNGSSQISTSSAAALLVITGLPRDLTSRECHFIFALAPDFSSLETSKNAISGDLTLHAKFGSIQYAQQVGQMLERRSDLFGNEVKVQVQTYSSPFVTQSNSTRPLYPSRPLFADSYWSQQPNTPLSSSGTDIFNQSRRTSLVSPTESVFPTSHLSHINLSNSSPQGHNDSSHVSAIGSNSTSMSGGNSGDGSSSGSSSTQPGGISPTHTGGGDRHSPTSVSHSSNSMAQSVIGAGAPGTSTLLKQQNQSSQPNHTMHSNQHSLSNQQHSPTHNQLPPPNPADQNPPCNTLYVGNLPPDTSEAELKDIFSEQPGYRRLCFRAKQNGPMCFVEFEDEHLAGNALSSLYGFALSNSVKGGIRLSYSKNPLGVRSRPIRK